MTLREDSSQQSFQKASVALVTTSDRYYVELPVEALDEQGKMLDSLIHFTFDTLNIQHLDLRILTETPCKKAVPSPMSTMSF